MMFFKYALRYVLAGNGRKRCLFGWLPDANIAADPGQHGVPAPYRYREVKGRDNAHYTQRMILLVHPMFRPLRMHGEAIQLAAEANGKVGNVYHFLYLAIAFL